MKKLPLGIENFPEIAKDCYYVDKTLVIRDILQLPKTSVLLFTRPRRFGKSLLLSMIQTFFEKSSTDPDVYFHFLKIAKENPKIYNQRGQYPVISLSFKDDYGTSFEEILSRSKHILALEYARHEDILGSDLLSDQERKYFQGIESENLDAVNTSYAISALLMMLEKCEKQKPILLIDEYDTPIQSAYENGFYKEAIDFFKPLYGQALKGNRSLSYSIITGVLEIAKESLFSGLNNLNVSTILDDSHDDLLGFTLEETRELLKYFSLDDKLDEVKKWYGGYTFGQKEIINPWSVLKYIESRKFAPYWVNTSSNSILGTLIINEDLTLGDTLSRLLSGERANALINSSFTYSDIKNNRGVLLSFLAFLGYLSARSSSVYGIYSLSIPNEEILLIFQNEIISRLYQDNGADLIIDFSKAFQTGDEKEIERLLKTTLLSSLSYYDFNYEKTYQIMILTLLTLTFENAEVKSEVNSGEGRCDILVIPKNRSRTGLVIEIRYLKQRTSEARLKASSEAALNQIMKKDYPEELKKDGINHVLCYGISFARKNVSISSKKIKY